jgi:hypothetical protein
VEAAPLLLLFILLLRHGPIIHKANQLVVEVCWPTRDEHLPLFELYLQFIHSMEARCWMIVDLPHGGACPLCLHLLVTPLMRWDPLLIDQIDDSRGRGKLVQK